MWTGFVRTLFTFPGYVVDKVKASAEVAQVWLRRDGRMKPRCPQCGACLRVNRTRWQTAKDLPLGPVGCVLLAYEAVQGYCAACRGYATVHPPGIDGHAQATQRLMAYVSQLCRYLPLTHVQQIVPVSAATAYRWDKAWLQAYVPAPDPTGLRILLIDEKAVRTGYGYVTLVMNGETGELLYWAEGKKKESLSPFFARLTPEQQAGIEAVAIDRNGAYYAVVKEFLPHAAVVYDKFHLIQNYHKVIDRVRNEEYREARAEDKEVIKGQRFNLYRNPANLSDAQARRLGTLLAINRNLQTVYVLKDALKRLWGFRYRAWALKYLEKWVGWATESGLPALVKFAQALWRDREEVTAYCRHPITTARLEAFNNTVSRFVHRACGHTDLDYLFLKVRQESLPETLQT